MAQIYHGRPSEWLHVEDEWSAYQVDMCVAWRVQRPDEAPVSAVKQVMDAFPGVVRYR